MKTIKVLAFCAALVIGFGAQAKTVATKKSKTMRKPAQYEWCKAHKWPIARDLPLANLVGEFQTFQGSRRIELLQIGWGEIVRGDTKHIVTPIFDYLSGTEQDEAMRGYYMAMAYVAQDQVGIEEAMKKWPKRVPLAKNRWGLAQMCEFYQKTLDAKRQPQSKGKAAAVKAPFKSVAKTPVKPTTKRK